MGRAGLNAEKVVAEAAELADEVGYDSVTLAALADRFGVASPSLYKHVDGLEDVRRRLAVLATRELGAALAGAVDKKTAGASDDRLRAMADAYRGYARAHPGRYQATVRAPAPGDTEHVEVSEAVLRTVLGMLAGYGIAGVDAVDAARTIRAALHGFIALEAAGGFGLPRNIERSYARLVEALHLALSAWPADQDR